MNKKTTISTPAGGLNRGDSEVYCGGKSVFKELLRRYPKLLVPYFQTARGDYFRRETLDRVLEAAEANQERSEALESILSQGS
jgi:hypothetical protein